MASAWTTTSGVGVTSAGIGSAVHFAGEIFKISAGVDIGGTFTDLVLHDSERGDVHVHKVRSTPDDPGHALVQGLPLGRAVLEMADRGEGAGRHMRRQRAREDEAGGGAAHEVAERGRGRHVAADDPEALSPHLRSRRRVESRLGAGGVPVTVLRAAIVVGDGGVSWEITRQLVKNLPVMVTPRWVNTRTQPIALDDAVHYLTGVLDRDEAVGRVFEIGGPDVLTYAEMLRRAARVRNGRTVPILTVPLLTPRLSSLWISLVTDVDTTTARNLIESMDTEVVVHDDSIQSVVPGRLMTYDEAVERALRDRGDGRPSSS